MSEKHISDDQVSDKQSELEWLAFQYLADELSPSERDEFETRLANEQGAREAVARSVELTQTIAVAHRSEQVVSKSHADKAVSSWRRVAWLATSVACCLALVLVYRSSKVPDTKSTDYVPIADLASAWVETVDEFGSSESHELTAIGAYDGFEMPVEDAPENELLDTPSWMFAAVEGLADSDEMDMEMMEESMEN